MARSARSADATASGPFKTVDTWAAICAHSYLYSTSEDEDEAPPTAPKCHLCSDPTASAIASSSTTAASHAAFALKSLTERSLSLHPETVSTATHLDRLYVAPHAGGRPHRREKKAAGVICSSSADAPSRGRCKRACPSWHLADAIDRAEDSQRFNALITDWAGAGRAEPPRAPSMKRASSRVHRLSLLVRPSTCWAGAPGASSLHQDLVHSGEGAAAPDHPSSSKVLEDAVETTSTPSPTAPTWWWAAYGAHREGGVPSVTPPARSALRSTTSRCGLRAQQGAREGARRGGPPQRAVPSATTPPTFWRSTLGPRHVPFAPSHRRPLPRAPPRPRESGRLAFGRSASSPHRVRTVFPFIKSPARRRARPGRNPGESWV